MLKVFLVACGVLASSALAAQAVTQDAPVPAEPGVHATRVAVEAAATPRHEEDARLDATAVMG